MTKKILMVVANPSVSTTTGWPVGFWASELTHAYQQFEQKGYNITIASPKGGKVELDALSDPRDKSGYSKDDTISLQYLNNREFTRILENTPIVSKFSKDDFDAIVIAGGQSPMFTFKDEKNLQKLFTKFYESEKVSAALCHGTSLLLYLKNNDGSSFVKGKKMTGFCNEEEDYADKAVGQKLMPFRIENEAKKLGAKFVKAEAFKSFAIRDKNLITGQQQNSGAETARLVIKALEENNMKKNNKRILITGATGTIGTEIVNQLKDNARFTLRAGYHSKKPNIGGMEWVKLDYSKPETIEAAFKDIDKAFLLTPFTDKTVEHVEMLVEAAKNAEVEYLVRLSAMGADENAPFLPGKWHWQSEQLIKKSGIPYTIIRPTFFMQNFINAYGETIKSQNSIYSPAGDGKAGFIDPRDVAAVVVKVLSSEGHKNKIYELTGPEAISYTDAANVLTKVLGRKITYVSISKEDARKNLEKMSMPEWMIDSLLGLANIIKQGYASSLTENVEKITGNKPRTFEMFARDNVSAFS